MAGGKGQEYYDRAKEELDNIYCATSAEDLVELDEHTKSFYEELKNGKV